MKTGTALLLAFLGGAGCAATARMPHTDGHVESAKAMHYRSTRYFTTIDRLIKEGKYGAALDSCFMAPQGDIGGYHRTKLYSRLGRIYDNMAATADSATAAGLRDNAVHYHEKALDEDPMFGASEACSSATALSDRYLQDGRCSDAQHVAERLLNSRQDFSSWFWLGQAELCNEDPEDAEFCFKMALECTKSRADSARVLPSLLEVYMFLGHGVTSKPDSTGAKK